MTLSCFTSLNGHDQDIEIYKHGILIGDREDDKCQIYLWQLWNFYVEIFISKINGSLLKTVGFDNVHRLDPYLDGIPIPGFN